MTCEACRAESACAYKFWYFIIAVLMLAYGVGCMFIPMAFPWSGAAPAEAATNAAWILPLIFSAGFVAANVVAAWGVTKIFAGPIALREGDKAYYLEKMRNSIAAAAGFTAAFRIIIYVMWMVHYS